MTDAEIADLVLALYEYSNGPTAKWDKLERPASDDGVCWGLKHVDGVDYVVFRGSTTIRDWARNLYAFANPFIHDQLGPLHPGFFDGMPEAWNALVPLLRGKQVVLTGHSLGAARATIMAGMFVLHGRTPVKLITFGSPKPGFQQLAKVVAPVPCDAYRNAWDVITRLPLTVGFEQYCDACRMTDVNVRPTGAALLWGPFAPHHMTLYRKALQ